MGQNGNFRFSQLKELIEKGTMVVMTCWSEEYWIHLLIRLMMMMNQFEELVEKAATVGTLVGGILDDFSVCNGVVTGKEDPVPLAVVLHLLLLWRVAMRLRKEMKVMVSHIRRKALFWLQEPHQHWEERF